MFIKWRQYELYLLNVKHLKRLDAKSSLVHDLSALYRLSLWLYIGTNNLTWFTIINSVSVKGQSAMLKKTFCVEKMLFVVQVAIILF